MSKFKVGDVVRCVSIERRYSHAPIYYTWLTVGKAYPVSRITGDDETWVVDDDGDLSPFPHELFVLDEPPEALTDGQRVLEFLKNFIVLDTKYPDDSPYCAGRSSLVREILKEVYEVEPHVEFGEPIVTFVPLP